MRRHCSWMLSVSFAACAAGPSIVDTRTDHIVSIDAVAADVAKADVVALGELHETPDVHRAHLQLIEEIFDRRPQLVIAMEMLERDAQTALLQYLQGMISEQLFLTEAGFPTAGKARETFQRDYGPVLEFARQHHLVVLAANAPRALVAKVRKEGLEAVAGDAGIARNVTVPDDDAYDDFIQSMAGHPGVTEETMRRWYVAQCVWDATMAETVTDYLARQQGPKPLVVLICGRQHSDRRRGTVRALLERMPQLDVRVLSTEEVADVAAGVYESPRDTADYIVVVPKVDRPARVHDSEPVAPPAAAGAPAPGPIAPRPVPGDVEQGGARPGFGFMPDYGGGERGVKVGPVNEGGPADRGGIREGDEILAVDGMDTPDIEAYVEALQLLRIGKQAKVKVLRDGKELDLEVEVGARSR